MRALQKPVEVQVEQWFRVKTIRDASDDTSVEYHLGVGYYRHPEIRGDFICSICSREMSEHGFMDLPGGGHPICPGDFIVTDVDGERFSLRPAVFAQLYEVIDEVAAPTPTDGAVRKRKLTP